MKLQRESEHQPKLWANGLGTTLEVHASPSSAAWNWRLSIAELKQDGPFSHLAGVDRALLVAHGVGMTLHIESKAHALNQFEGMEFSGDSEAQATLHAGPVRDLNLMVRRDASLGSPRLHVVRAKAGTSVSPENTLAIVVLEGSAAIDPNDGSLPAGRFDVFLCEPKETQTVTAVTDAVLVLAQLISA